MVTLDASLSGAASPASSRSVSPIENVITLLGGVWLMAGLFIDGYAHSNIIDTATEDFFTPWHAIFYSGFTVSAAWIGWLMYSRRGPGGLATWIPNGYGWAVAGLLTFAVGGIGDGIWHTIFGVETSVDALLSPTHLVLLTGLILIVAAPMRSVAIDGGSPWFVVGSITMISLLAAFFSTFARPLSDGWLLSIPYDPQTGNNELWTTWMLAGTLVTTVIMAVGAVYLFQRVERPPVGALALMWGLPAFGEGAALSTTDPGVLATAAVSATVGGLVADVVSRSLPGDRRVRAGGAIAAGIFVTWSLWTALAHVLVEAINNPAEIWTGQIVIAVMVAGAVAMLGFPSGSGADQRR